MRERRWQVGERMDGSEEKIKTEGGVRQCRGSWGERKTEMKVKV